MYQIRNWLYTAGYTAASDRRWLQHKGIRAVLTLHRPVDYPNMNLLHLPLDSATLTDEAIARSTTFMRQHAQGNQPVLTTCVNGTGLSVAIAIAGLKEIEDISLREAFLAVRLHNQEAMPDQRHWEALRRYYSESDLFWDVWQEIVQREQQQMNAHA